MQLQNDYSILRQAGLGLAAISYDSRGVLSEFAKRKSITFPLLSDHESRVIRAYGVADQHYREDSQVDVDTERVYASSSGKVPVFGLSYPAVFVLRRDHRVKWRFVYDRSELRLTGAAILEEAAGAIADESRIPIPSHNIQVIAAASNTSIGLGNFVRIAVELQIPKGFHVYGPEIAGGYKGISWEMDRTPCLMLGEPVYPEPVLKLMKSTDETLPVYESTLRISREMILAPEIHPSDPSVYKQFGDMCLDSTSRSRIEVSGVLRFQACDEQRCYPPETARLHWEFQFLSPDRQRSPQDIRRESEN